MFFVYLCGMFQHFSNKKKVIPTALCVLSLIGSWGCASTGSPGGGFYDETPPVLVKSDPGEGALGVTKQKITMRFDENIKLDNANDKLTISPPQEKTPSILSNAKTLTIELQDTLKPNTTYTIDLGDAVQDNNEGNPLENLMLTFSTGMHIDTMKVLGTLLNAEDLEPITGAFVGIYRTHDASCQMKDGAPDVLNCSYCLENSQPKTDSLQLAIDSIVALYPDSLFSLRPFERAGKTDAYGRFTISGVAPGRYKMFALKDGNTNYKYDTFDEDIAFLDSLIVPSVGSHIAYDTIWNRFDSTAIDSIHVHEVTDFYPNDICLLMFNEGRVTRYLDDIKWQDSTTLNVRFAARMPEPPIITLLDEEEVGAASTDKRSWLICEPNPTNDTLTYWLRDSLIYHRDTLKLVATYPFTQDGLDIVRTDTIALEKPEVKKPQENKEKDDKKGKKGRKKKNDEAAADSLPPKPVFMTLRMLEKTLEIGGKPHFEASAPVDTLYLDHFRLEVQKDTIWQPLEFEFIPDSVSLRKFTLIAKPHFSPGQQYRLIADSASVFDIYGHPIDSVAFAFNEKKVDQYSHLLINVRGVRDGAFVQLLNEKDKPVMQAQVKNGQAKFPQAPVGKFYARLVIDTNGNGKFDAGWLPTRTQPEQVYYMPKMLEMREGWQYSEDWDVKAFELTKQKLDDVKQNKPKAKQERKSKNEEYLREHPSARRK